MTTESTGGGPRRPVEQLGANMLAWAAIQRVQDIRRLVMGDQESQDTPEDLEWQAAATDAMIEQPTRSR